MIKMGLLGNIIVVNTKVKIFAEFNSWKLTINYISVHQDSNW